MKVEDGSFSDADISFAIQLKALVSKILYFAEDLRWFAENSDEENYIRSGRLTAELAAVNRKRKRKRY
jgi:hypothetical protein